MGRDKALLPVAGRPMAARVADALRFAGAAEVLAVGGDGAALTALGLEHRPDEHPGDGPLPATITALRAATEAHVLVVSCDLVSPAPDAMAATVQALRDHPGAVGAVPVDDGERQWVHAAWRRDAARPLAAAYEAGVRSLRRAGADLLVFEVLGLDPAALADADEPSDLPGSLRTMADVPEIEVAELAANVHAGAALIDVREPGEFAAARVPGAQLIPLGDLVERIDEVPTDGTVYVICASGARSARAAAHLRRQGIDAINVAGGTLAWIDAGHPTDSDQGSGASPS